MYNFCIFATWEEIKKQGQSFFTKTILLTSL